MQHCWGSSTVKFVKLNEGWNAEPNVPDPTIALDGQDLLLQFYLNAFMYSSFEEDEVGILRFKQCSRYRLGFTNDEGWHMGQCRFSSLAPQWGEFYSIEGDETLLGAPDDWVIRDGSLFGQAHFLFYLHDVTFECSASDWEFADCADNALLRLVKR